MPRPIWDIFCRVIDNYGDMGVCWRLARQLVAEHGFEVRLWVDVLASFQAICPEFDPNLARQTCEGVLIARWESAAHVVPGDCVIEAFACELPAAWQAAMAAKPGGAPVWINLEYLSAEAWVADCHGLNSPHPRLPLNKTFFFPGLRAGTGGVLCEADLAVTRVQFQENPAVRTAWWAALGIVPRGQMVSLFCYENPVLPALLDAWAAQTTPLSCVVTAGKAQAAVCAYLGLAAWPVGQVVQRGALTLHALPFLSQPDFDRLLWACDVNLVRGEDSWVRAQWAGRPMLWQIYPQAEAAHEPKLRAFIELYGAGLPPAVFEAWANLQLAWNGQSPLPIQSAWQTLQTHTAKWAEHAAHWPAELRLVGDLAGNLARWYQKQLK